MKKVTKTMLLAIALLTLVFAIAAVVMKNAVSGDKLFYMNSTLGYIYAVSYRWVGLISILLFLFWAMLAAIKRKAILSMLSGWKDKTGKKVKADTIDTDSTIFPVSEGKKICIKCGGQMAEKSKFCPFCGELAADPDK